MALAHSDQNARPRRDRVVQWLTAGVTTFSLVAASLVATACAQSAGSQPNASPSEPPSPTGGVLPAPSVDPGIQRTPATPPAALPTPVIPPPGSPGGDPTVVPK